MDEAERVRLTLRKFSSLKLKSRAGAILFISALQPNLSPVAIGEQRSSRCGYTGSCSMQTYTQATHGLVVALHWIEVAVEFGSILSD